VLPDSVDEGVAGVQQGHAFTAESETRHNVPNELLHFHARHAAATPTSPPQCQGEPPKTPVRDAPFAAALQHEAEEADLVPRFAAIVGDDASGTEGGYHLVPLGAGGLRIELEGSDVVDV